MANVVFVHAHPDDEALLTAGTMRALHEAGHLVWLIVATDGEAGLTAKSHAENLGATRRAELAKSAQVLGIHRVIHLGYKDSGLRGEVSDTNTFINADFEAQVARLSAQILEINTDVLIGYDEHGGYGHPDHQRVHQLTRAAADRTAVPIVLEATIDRQTVAGAIDRFSPILQKLGLTDVLKLADGFTARADIGYCVDVKKWCGPKRAAMKAHVSQSVGGSIPRTLQVLAILPRPLFARVAGREWYRIVRENGTNPFRALPQWK